MFLVYFLTDIIRICFWSNLWNFSDRFIGNGCDRFLASAFPELSTIIHAPISPHPVRPIFQPVAVAVGFQCLVLLRHLPADFLCALGIACGFKHIRFRFGLSHLALKLPLLADLVVQRFIFLVVILDRGLPEQPVGNAAQTMPAVYPEQPVRLAEARLRQRDYLVLAPVDVGYLGSPAGA